MFDYVIGTSTGALVVILAFMYQLPLDECEVLYKEKSTEMFSTNKLTGSAKLAWNYAYHDSGKFEEILRYVSVLYSQSSVFFCLLWFMIRKNFHGRLR